MGRRDDRRELEVVPVEPVQPPPPTAPPLGVRPVPGPGTGPAAGSGRAVPVGGTADRRGRRRSSGNETDWWRWTLALALVIAAIAAVIAFDRDVAEPPRSAPPTTVAPAAAQQRPPVSEGTLPVPPGMSGILYALGEDESLIELDLASGRTRLAALQFDVAPWFVSQVVALRDIVLVGNRREVFSVDRATMTDQQRVAQDRWIVAPPSGAWAALVPFGAATGDIVILDGAGQVVEGPRSVLPSGASVQGATDDGLVVDFAGSLQLLRPDGAPGPELGDGRYLASGGAAVARVTCALQLCSVLSGTVAEPDAVDLGPQDVLGTWTFGNAGVFDSSGSRLAVVAPGPAADGVARIFDLRSSGAVVPVDSPSALRPPSGPPPLAFSADGDTLVHGFDNQLVLWRFAGDADSGGPAVDRLTFDGTVLAVTVTEQPPPPPPDAAGPPPSFA
ncbi:MAG: hypothetical protein AB7O92_22510 [Acidimicrobiia bacterium]